MLLFVSSDDFTEPTFPLSKGFLQAIKNNKKLILSNCISLLVLTSMFQFLHFFPSFGFAIRKYLSGDLQSPTLSDPKLPTFAGGLQIRSSLFSDYKSQKHS